jgi:PRTRC genetic system protein E
MFKALEAFRGQIESLHLTIAFTGDQRQIVTVAPRITEEAVSKCAALATPFSFTATAEELEAGFVQALADVQVVHKTLADQVATQTAALAAAKKAVTKPAVPTRAVGVSTATKEPEEDAVPAPQPAPAPKPVTITGAAALFDDDGE